MKNERVMSTILPVQQSGPLSTLRPSRQTSQAALGKYACAPQPNDMPQGTPHEYAVVRHAYPQSALLQVQQAPLPHVWIDPQGFEQFAP